MDQLRAIRTFLEVIDRGGFAGAARSLGQSPAVVTRQVADLERHLGVRLLNRTTRRMAVTPAGEGYAAQVRTLLDGLCEAEAAVQAKTVEPQGVLRVQVPPAFAVHQLARDLPRFRERHPKVSIELHATGPVHSVDERFDLSIIVSQGLSLDGDFIARPLARSELVLCAAPAYLEQHGRPHHPNDLVQHDALIPPLLGARRGVTFHRGPLDDEPAASVTVQPPEPVVASLQLEAMLAAADAGLGIAALPSFMAAQSLRAGRLERVLDRWHVVTLSIHVGVASRQHLPARTRVFRDFLVETYGAAPDDDPWLTALGAEAPGLALGSPGPGFTFARLPS